MFLRRKKALAFSTIIGILVVIASFIAITFVITHFFGKAEAATAETVCRASVAAREKTTQRLEIADVKVAEIHLTPLLCKTIDKKIPEKKDAKKEDVMREFAESMVRCWWMFGDGLIDDVFKEGSPIKKNCFICHIAITGKTDEFKNEISSEEFSEYLVNTPYKIAVEGDRCKNLGGFCVANEGDCIDKHEKMKYDEDNLICKKKDPKTPSCCHSSYSCWNSGGECKEKGNYDGFVEYDKWECPSGTCYIKDKNYVTYARYIQSYNGDGNIIITTPIKPEEAYAVSFGSPHGKCGWCQWVGAGVGATVGVVITVKTFGAGALVMAPLATSIASLVTGVLGYVVTGMSVEEFAKVFLRDVNTIYLTTLDEALAESRCNRITDVKEE